MALLFLYLCFYSLSSDSSDIFPNGFIGLTQRHALFFMHKYTIIKGGNFTSVQNDLKQYFPMIRSREEILSEIQNRKHLYAMFSSWRKEQQEEFLDFCTGSKGVRILYDSFFKEILNPEYYPERLDSFLSEMLGQEVKVLKVLPNDTTRITADSALLITDIVVELEDRSIANIEVQKIGYKFPGERAACYSADLLLRQYKRVRGIDKEANYKDIKPVYIIVIFERSPAVFHNFPDVYMHTVRPASDTGIQLNLLQNYLFLSLDIFKANMHNKAIRSKADAWLWFFSMDDPEEIVKLLTSYPEFKPMYEDIYRLCCSTERVMNMFSEELHMLDVNTTKYMMDEMQEEIDVLANQREEMLKEKERLLGEKELLLGEKERLLGENEQLHGENEQLHGENEQLLGEKKLLSYENVQLIQEKRQLTEKAEQMEKEHALMEKEIHKLKLLLTDYGISENV